MDVNQVSVLVVAEHDNSSVSVDTLRALKAALDLKTTDGISVLVAGHQCHSVVEQIQRLEGIKQVLVADDELYQHPLAESLSLLIAREGKAFTHLIAAATTFGKNVMPRVAALLDVGQLSDIVAIESPDVVVRPVYAGNALARVRSDDSVKVMTVRSSAFDALQVASGELAEEHTITIEPDPGLAEFVNVQKTESARPELPAARVVVSGGRGLGSKENFALVEQLADKLGGAIGASRAAVDAGFVSNDLQVGQTGKIVAPELYIAVGISGAIQHLAGMKDSKVIVAINSDPDAPIFQVADYGLVGDLFEIMPALIESV